MRPLKCNDMHESTMNQNKSETNCSQREGERDEKEGWTGLGCSPTGPCSSAL